MPTAAYARAQAAVARTSVSGPAASIEVARDDDA